MARCAPRNVTLRFSAARRGHPASVFFLFSSRLGCLGSLAVSALLTLLVLLLLDVL
jgi:hypothetical protein